QALHTYPTRRSSDLRKSRNARNEKTETKRLKIMNTPDTPSSLQTVIEHFKGNGWNFHLDPNRPLLHAGLKGKNGNFRCVAAVDPDRKSTRLNSSHDQ